MKKLLNYFVLPFLAGCVVAFMLHSLIPFQHVHSVDMLSYSQSCFTFGLLGFLFGFLPCFIQGLAFVWMEENKPFLQVSELSVNDVISAQDVYTVGQVFSVGNCGFRVKSLK